ncbi:MAG: sialidase family protein [Candidatus Zixiibacteriota bacterium]
MQNYISDSTSSYPAGISPGNKMFRVNSGPYAGRVVILLHKPSGQTSDFEIKLSYADYPYTEWSPDTAVVTDSADSPFDAVMDPSGNIYIVYTKYATDELTIRKLWFAYGNWTPQTPVTIYDQDENYFPSVIILSSGRIYVSWSRYAAGQYFINVKYSDNGVSWEAGSSDPGTALTSGMSSAYSRLIQGGSYLFAFYSRAGTNLSYRRINVDSGDWESESDIASGSNFDNNFNAAVANNGLIGVAYDDGQLCYREYNGSQWSNPVVIDTEEGDYPQLKYINNNPYILYLRNFGDGQTQVLLSSRTGAVFSNPGNLDPAKNILEGVILYDTSGGTYEDVTSAASNDTAGDLFHSVSAVLLKNIGDGAYFGMAHKFIYLKILLSTGGVGGNVIWQYFNGNDWVSFVPSGGAYHFDTLNKQLLLWDDYSSTPANWQKAMVNNGFLYWIRAVVTSDYSTGSVGSQITSIPNTKVIIVME